MKNKMILLFSSVLFCGSVLATDIFPHKPGAQEIRATFASKGGFTSGDWEVGGQLVGSPQTDSSLGLSGVFGMDKEKAHIGAEVTYSVNKFVYFSLTGQFHNTTQLGALGRVYLDIPAFSDTVSFLPFVYLNHKKLGAVGLLTYFHISSVAFSVGVSYSPPLKDDQNHNVSILVGTGFHKLKRVSQ